MKNLGATASYSLNLEEMYPHHFLKQGLSDRGFNFGPQDSSIGKLIYFEAQWQILIRLFDPR